MKKFISGLLGILFLVILIVGIFVCTYVFSQPSRTGDSRELISGTWTDKEENVTFEFSSEGDFKMYYADDETVIAKGWFKIDEDDKKFQVLVAPSDRDETVDIGLTFKFFSTISYKNLTVPDKDDEEGVATCKFIFQNSDGVYSCERTDMEGTLYDGKS